MCPRRSYSLYLKGVRHTLGFLARGVVAFDLVAPEPLRSPSWSRHGPHSRALDSGPSALRRARELMPRKQLSATDASPSDKEEKLPTCSGSHLELAQWLRELLNCAHLLDSDLAYFIATASASAITNSGKTAVLNVEHALLLQRKLVLSLIHI